MATLRAFALVIAMLLSILPFQAFAQTGGKVIGPHIVTLQPGKTFEINVHGFCLNYGLPFPGAVLKPIELASAPLRNAAIYGLANGYIESNAFDVEKAIWFLSDGTRLKGQDYTLADKIIAYANSGVQPADVVAGVPHMVELVKAGSLQASISNFVNIAPDKGSFFGNGKLKITNVSAKPQKFVVSYGSVALDEAAGDQQNMLVFPSDPAPVTATPPPTGGLLPPTWIAALAGLGLASLGLVGLRRRSAKAA
jgi:hypothetical protein